MLGRTLDVGQTIRPTKLDNGGLGFSANAHAEVKSMAHHVTVAGGGFGAAREFCDVLLVASGRYAGLLEESRG